MNALYEGIDKIVAEKDAEIARLKSELALATASAAEDKPC